VYIGTRIKIIRKEHGWTQAELASSLGITRSALCHYEQNRRQPGLDVILEIANLFNVSIDDLVTRSFNI
jgi:transcriptional regulator with XRE-family HTH domain